MPYIIHSHYCTYIHSHISDRYVCLLYMLVIIVIDFGRVIWRCIFCASASAVGVGNVLWSVVGVCGGTSSGVVCDVCVMLVWCWCSGVVVGGAVVVWWW